MINEHNQSPTRYIPIPDWHKYHPWPSAAGLRHLVFYRKTNGFESVFKKINRRVLVDERAFMQCMASLRMEG